MIVIRNKKHTFNIDVVGGYSLDEFKKHCKDLVIFNQLPIKERVAAIKEAYGIVKGNVEKGKGGKSIQDIPTDNKGGNGNDSRSK